VNRDVKIGIVISIAVFLVLVLYWSTRRPKEVAPSSLEPEEEIAVVEEPEWQRQFEKEQEAIVEMYRRRPIVEVEEPEEETTKFIDLTGAFQEKEPGPEEGVTPVSKRTHIIQKGDSLWKLAEKYYGDASKWRLIQETNKEIVPRTTALKVGLEIIIPELEVAPREKAESPFREPVSTRTYVIRRGDLLWNLAVKFYGDGTKWKVIHEANKGVIPNPTLLPVGKKIVIPEVASGERVLTNT